MVMISKFPCVWLHYFALYAGVVNFFYKVKMRTLFGDQHLLRHGYYVVNNRINAIKTSVNNAPCRVVLNFHSTLIDSRFKIQDIFIRPVVSTYYCRTQC